MLHREESVTLLLRGSPVRHRVDQLEPLLLPPAHVYKKGMGGGELLVCRLHDPFVGLLEGGLMLHREEGGVTRVTLPVGENVSMRAAVLPPPLVTFVTPS
jgi:hypothetical protein